MLQKQKNKYLNIVLANLGAMFALIRMYDISDFIDTSSWVWFLWSATANSDNHATSTAGCLSRGGSLWNGANEN